MERLSLKKIIAPALALALGLAACSEDSTSVEEQLRATHAATVELCTEQAQADFDAEFVAVDNDPTTPEDEAFDANQRKSTEGVEFFQSAFESCVEVNFNDVADSLTVETPMPEGMEPVPTSTVAPSTTTEG